MKTLRDRVIRLARQRPDLRSDLLPLLKNSRKAMRNDGWSPVILDEDELYDILEDPGSMVEMFNINSNRWEKKRGLARNPGRFWAILQKRSRGTWTYTPKGGLLSRPNGSTSYFRIIS